MSDTPRTDRFIEQGYVLSGHARQLERELSAMTLAKDKALDVLKRVAAYSNENKSLSPYALKAVLNQTIGELEAV